MSRAAESTGDSDAVSHVFDAFRTDGPMPVHDSDDYEGETDLVYPAGAVSSAGVARMRNDAGGPVRIVLPNDVSESLGLPFMDDVLDHPTASSYDLVYDLRSPFSSTMDHRDPFTGIAGRDHAMTIPRLAPAAEAVRVDEYDTGDFGDGFCTPGHVHLLRDASNLLSDCQNHTELGLTLADEAGISPAVAVYGMLDDKTGTVLPKGATRDYADRYSFTFVDGDSLIDELI